MSHHLLSARSLALSTLFALAALGCQAEVDSESDPESTDEAEGAIATGEACPEIDATASCTAESGAESERFCLEGADGKLAWSDCTEPDSAGSTPLVLSFGAPIEFLASTGAFSLSTTVSASTDWVGASTPWLVLDRNGNGLVDDGGELFGSATILASGTRAPNGFAALAELDDNRDGRITAEDAGFAKLALWSDGDADRVSSSAELSTLASTGIVSIELGFVRAEECDDRGNCGIERARFEFRSASGAMRSGQIVDVHLRHR
jgi:hypothetical protein